MKHLQIEEQERNEGRDMRIALAGLGHEKPLSSMKLLSREKRIL